MTFNINISTRFFFYKILTSPLKTIEFQQKLYPRFTLNKGIFCVSPSKNLHKIYPAYPELTQHFCLCFVLKFKNGHRLTLKSLFTPPQPPLETFFRCQMKGISFCLSFWLSVLLSFLLSIYLSVGMSLLLTIRLTFCLPFLVYLSV